MKNQEQQIEQSTKKPKWLVPVIVVIGVSIFGLVAWGAYLLFKPVPPEELPEKAEELKEATSPKKKEVKEVEPQEEWYSCAEESDCIRVPARLDICSCELLKQTVLNKKYKEEWLATHNCLIDNCKDTEQYHITDLAKIRCTNNKCALDLNDGSVCNELEEETLKKEACERLFKGEFARYYKEIKSSIVSEPGTSYLAGEILISFKEDVSVERIEEVISSLGFNIKSQELLELGMVSVEVPIGKERIVCDELENMVPEIDHVSFNYLLENKSQNLSLTACHSKAQEIIQENGFISIDSCRVQEFEIKEQKVYYVSIAYGEGMDCPAGCIFEEYNKLIDNEKEYDVSNKSLSVFSVYHSTGHMCGWRFGDWDRTLMYNEGIKRDLIKEDEKYRWKILFKDFKLDSLDEEGKSCIINGYLLSTIDLEEYSSETFDSSHLSVEIR